MNINNYKNAIKEIQVNTDKIRSRFETEYYNKPAVKLHYPFLKKPICACFISFALIVIFVSIGILYPNNTSNLSIKVYASDRYNEFILSDSPVTLSASSQFNMGSVTNNETGVINFNLNLKCDGGNIKRITYQLSDKKITKENREDASAWFVENIFYIADSDSKKQNDENIYEYYISGNQHFLTKMIGNAYSVNYQNQHDKNYGLVINLYKDKVGNFTAKDFFISVKVLLKNGKTMEKQILVHPLVENILTSNGTQNLPKIQMQLKR